MLILLNGPPQAGKTSLKNFLVERGAEEIILSKPFYSFVRDALDLTDEEMKIYKDDPHGLFQAPVRKALIAAADSVELCDPAVWVKAALRDFVHEPGKVYVLDSIGKQAQLDWVASAFQANSFVLVRVCRDAAYDASVRQFSDGRDNIHGSSVIQTHAPNTGTLEDLRHLAADLYDKVKSK